MPYIVQMAYGLYGVYDPQHMAFILCMAATWPADYMAGGIYGRRP